MRRPTLFSSMPTKRRKTIRKPVLLRKRLAAYAEAGQAAPPRAVFRAGIPAYFETSKHKPFCSLPVYDDTTESELLERFRYYKKLRLQHLRQSGIRVRKHITTNIHRDHIWFQMAQRQLKKGAVAPNYRQIAEQWSRRNPAHVREMLLQYIWRSSESAVSDELREAIQRAKTKGEIYETFTRRFATNDSSSDLKEELDTYISTHLPHVIRSAVQRYKPSR